MEYLLHTLILVGIYVILAASLNLMVGYTGLLSIGHAGFFGAGAYVAALMALNVHSPFMINLVCAAALSGALGAVIGVPSLRIRDDHFVMVTLAFQVIMFNVLNNWIRFTGGPMGLPAIPRPRIFGLTVSSNVGFLLLVGTCCAFILWIIRRIVRSPIGRVLKAIREDEILAQAAGKNICTFKVLACVLSAAMAGVAGAIYAHYITFIDPTSFTLMESVLVISMVIIGGSGSLWGPVSGAAALVILPEALRFIGLPSSVAANTRQVLYGGLLVAFMIWRPAGLVGEYAFRSGEVRE